MWFHSLICVSIYRGLAHFLGFQIFNFIFFCFLDKLIFFSEWDGGGYNVFWVIENWIFWRGGVILMHFMVKVQNGIFFFLGGGGRC